MLIFYKFRETVERHFVHGTLRREASSRCNRLRPQLLWLRRLVLATEQLVNVDDLTHLSGTPMVMVLVRR